MNQDTSGRLKIFKKDFLASLHKPIFGHGLGVNNANATGSHNSFGSENES